MDRSKPLLAALLASLVLVGTLPALPRDASAQLPPSPGSIALQTVASGLTSPLGMVHAGDGSGRMFLLEQRGTVRVLHNGVLDPDFYLDIRSKVSCCGERGLLGMAFYPDFETSGRLIVSYTRAGDGASVLERLTVADPANGKPPASGTVLMVVPQPFSNHNGGGIAFGPDGMLYFGLGDGGSGGDPQNHAQNRNSLLGKMLRIDVSGPGGYAIPADNPWANGGGRPEVWAYGLRNPWRWSFDRATGEMWIGDVGQNLWEEVNYWPSSLPAPRNFGWRPFEGMHLYRPTEVPGQLADRNLTFPVTTYDHAEGCSVTGGYVYRGPGLTELQGSYLYSDYCSGTIWAAWGQGLLRLHLVLLTTNLRVVSFGEDEQGNVFVVHYGGTVHKIVPS